MCVTKHFLFDHVTLLEFLLFPIKHHRIIDFPTNQKTPNLQTYSKSQRTISSLSLIFLSSKPQNTVFPTFFSPQTTLHQINLLMKASPNSLQNSPA